MQVQEAYAVVNLVASAGPALYGRHCLQEAASQGVWLRMFKQSPCNHEVD